MMMFGTVRRWFYGLTAIVGFVLYRMWKGGQERLDAMTAPRFQAKAALDDAGLPDQVESYMAGEDVPRRVKLAWEEASFRRGSNMVDDIGAELGLSESEIDALFQEAQQIEA